MEILAGVAVDHSTWDDKLTTVNDYDDVQCHWPYSSSVRSSYWNCECLGGKTLYFTAATNNLLVKILGSLDEGVTFPVTVESEFSVAVGSRNREKRHVLDGHGRSVGRYPKANG